MIDELLQDFLEEAREHLDSVDQLILELEKAPKRKDLITSLFRDIHSIKGTCGMFGFEKLSSVSHKTEDLLGKMREGEIQATAELVSLLFVAFDVIRFILSSIEKTSEEPNQNFDKLTVLLDRAMGAKPVKIEDSNLDSTTEVEVAEQSGLEEALIDQVQDSENLDLTQDEAEEKIVEEIASTEDSSKPHKPQASETLKVNLDILDKMMNGVGELVLARNQLIELLKRNESSEFSNAIHQLNHITSTLQETVMKTRMRPIGEAWSKLPRMVRDLERATKKKIDLVLKGESTELDRQILQCIQDPLTHCVRNSADHGLEEPQERLDAGKSENGTITLEACQEGGSIIIAIRDNGRGIDTEKIKAKSIEKGIITEDEASGLSKEQSLQLIFEPGFSTAEKVTEISGRGVGMDVVKSSIQKLGGTVKIHSELGSYTKIEFRIPLTLAIVSALTVKISTGLETSTFAVPQISISELIQVNQQNLENIYKINNTFVFKRRNQLLPLVDLKRVINSNNEPCLKEKMELEDKTIIVLHVEDRRYGLLVDEVCESQEIVVKAVSKTFDDLRFLSGATILGDGTVVLILDPAHLIHAADIKDVEKEETGDPMTDFTDISTINDYLLFQTNDNTIKSIPIRSVDRLEEFPKEKIEKVDGRYVIQYRGVLLPLYQNPDGEDLTLRDERVIPTVIMKGQDKIFGIMTKQVVDIACAEGELEKIGDHEEVQGSTVIRGRATEILDPDFFLKRAIEDSRRAS